MLRRTLLKKPLVMIYGIAGIGMLGHILVQPILPIFARRLGASGLEVGLLTSGFMLARAITSFFVGRHIDQSGRRESIIRAGLLMLFSLTLLYFWAGDLFVLILLRFGQGICSGLIWPVAQTMVAENATEGYKTRALSLYQITGRIGALLSRLFLGIGLLFAGNIGLSEIGSFRMIFLLAAAIIFVGFIESLLLPRQERTRGDVLARRKPYTLFILGFAFGALLALTPISLVYLNEHYGISPLGLAAMLLILDVITMFVMYLSSHLTDIIGFNKALMIIAIPCFLAAVFLPFVSVFVVFVVLYFVMRTAISSFLPISRSHATNTNAEIGSNIGTLNMMTNLGAVVGPLVGGMLYDTMSGGLKIGGYTVIALFLLPALIIQLRKS
ncbi:MAG: MFS transporter [bacterium]